MKNPELPARTHIEASFRRLRERGIDPVVLEANLPRCKCGRDQVIAAIGIPVLGVIRISARCTEPDRKVCRVAKRLRRYKHEVPKPKVLAPVERMTEAEAEEMGIVGFELDSPDLPETERDEDFAIEQAAEKAAEEAAGIT